MFNMFILLSTFYVYRVDYLSGGRTNIAVSSHKLGLWLRLGLGLELAPQIFILGVCCSGFSQSSVLSFVEADQTFVTCWIPV